MQHESKIKKELKNIITDLSMESHIDEAEISDQTIEREKKFKFITEFIKGEKELANLVITLVTKNIPPELLNEIEKWHMLSILLNKRFELICLFKSDDEALRQVSIKNSEWISEKIRRMLDDSFSSSFNSPYLDSMNILEEKVAKEREEIKQLNKFIKRGIF